MQSKHALRSHYFLRTLWLFTVSDHKTFVLPQTAFGILGALSGDLTADPKPKLLAIMSRVPHVLLWTWLNTLVFTLANQRLPEAVAEDKLNKPWRPLAAGRISTSQARRLLLCAIPLCLIGIFFCLGAPEETVLLFCLTWMYNDLGGAEEHFVLRNLVIAAAYALYANGALRVACNQRRSTFAWRTHVWEAMISGVILTTMQVQDLKDQEGDRARDRLTAPLVIGDASTRWTIAFPVLLFSIGCPAFWDLSLSTIAGMIPVALGTTVAVRVLRFRSRSADRATWKLWSYWLIALYALPLAKNPRVFASFFDWANKRRLRDRRRLRTVCGSLLEGP